MPHDHPSELGSDAPPLGKFPGSLASRYLFWIILIPVVLFGGLMLVLIFGGSAAPTTGKSSSPGQKDESGLDTARQSLTRQTDLTACRGALNQINAELGEKPALRPPACTKEQNSWLHDHLNLSDEEMSEIESSHYTRLDHQHLFRCLLLRDAAGALETKGVRGKAGGQVIREKPLDQAKRAFAWVMREVRLRQHQGEDTPPSFVVRRGSGNALERALVFLALLEQLGEPESPRPELLGFLLQVPNDAGGMRLWACGVLAGDGKDVYLFDPHLGLPLPGPKGEGVATLVQAREQPEVLAQLNAGDKLHYPVTAELAREAQAQLICPLSALSPRMGYLQDKLLAPAVRVRLAADAATDYERIQAACSAGVKKPAPVLVPRDRCTLLYRFLPEEEGGVDATARLRRFYQDMVPWNYLHPWFRREDIFPPNSGLGKQVRGQFAAFFYYSTMEAGRSRDELLRGHYSAAVPALVTERERCRDDLVQLANAAALDQKAEKWLEHATSVYAALHRAKQPEERRQAEQQVKDLWESNETLPIRIIINSSAATARKPEVDYQLALCAQEQAEQLQARLDLQEQVGVSPDKFDLNKAQADWEKALNAWKRFEEDYPRHRDRAAARRLRGRAEAMLGDHKAAIASWKDVSGFSTDLEKLASLYLAQQWEKRHPANASDAGR